jgi:hypothetical protein
VWGPRLRAAGWEGVRCWRLRSRLGGDPRVRALRARPLGWGRVHPRVPGLGWGSVGEGRPRAPGLGWGWVGEGRAPRLGWGGVGWCRPRVPGLGWGGVGRARLPPTYWGLAPLPRPTETSLGSHRRMARCEIAHCLPQRSVLSRVRRRRPLPCGWRLALPLRLRPSSHLSLDHRQYFRLRELRGVPTHRDGGEGCRQKVLPVPGSQGAGSLAPSWAK